MQASNTWIRMAKCAADRCNHLRAMTTRPQAARAAAQEARNRSPVSRGRGLIHSLVFCHLLIFHLASPDLDSVMAVFLYCPSCIVWLLVRLNCLGCCVCLLLACHHPHTHLKE